MIRLSVPSIGDAEIDAVVKVLRTGNLVYGTEGAKLEAELASYLGVSECIVVSSGTAALHLTIMALGLGPGDAVIVPDFTFPATANAVAVAGATPVFVDVSPLDYCLDPEQVEDLCKQWSRRDKLRGIVPVHQFGCPADMTAILDIAGRFGLTVIEDAACALGTTINGKAAGTLGHAGCFSFHPRKAMTTGEGGAVVTKDSELAERVRLLRNHGARRTDAGVEFLLQGLNYRLTDFQSALGRIQLENYPRRLQKRRDLKETYLRALRELPHIRLPDDTEGHVWQTLLVSLDEGLSREVVMAFLRQRGVETSVGAQSVSNQPSYTGYPSPLKKAPWVSKRLADHGLALPFCESYAAAEVRIVRDALAEALGP